MGTFGWTDRNGLHMGKSRFNSVMSGSINANKPGHAILVGKYNVIGFAPLDVIKSFNWSK